MNKVGNIFYSLMTLLFLDSRLAYSAALSSKALFYRCYRQITQTFPNSNSALVKQVESNQIDPITACISVLNKADFTANDNTRIGNPQDQEALSVLRTFQNLHYSWFTNKLADTGIGDERFSMDVIDTGGPALFYTKALFTPNYQFKNTFLGSINIESDRLDGRPEKAVNSSTTREKYAFTSPDIPFLKVGPLIGYTKYGQRDYVGTSNKKEAVLEFGNNWGGGILGSFSYMYMNVQENNGFKSTGASGVPRKWAKNVISDFLCRELPVVRYDDGLSFLSSNSNSATFRQEGACVRCHTTMDRMSGVIRNVRPRSQGVDSGTDTDSFTFMDKWDTDREGNETWTETTDANFYRKPLNGHFLYRTHDGKKIDEALTGVESLGKILGDTENMDDVYICAAKRYYHYLTGIEANIDDIADPQYGRTLSSNEITHRNEVIGLGKNFKKHQSMKKLIEEILRKPQFKDSAFKK